MEDKASGITHKNYTIPASIKKDRVKPTNIPDQLR
jgi:hypothetical protein